MTTPHTCPHCGGALPADLPTAGLTSQQAKLLAFIDSRGVVSPSFDEMKEALGLKSKSSVHRLLGDLEKRGHIRRLPHKARAIAVVRGAR